MRFISTEVTSCPDYEYLFERDDLIIPSEGILFAFKWRDGLKLRPEHNYNKANSAEETYFYKKLLNGYGVLGVSSIQELLNLNLKTFATNLDEL